MDLTYQDGANQDGANQDGANQDGAKPADLDKVEAIAEVQVDKYSKKLVEGIKKALGGDVLDSDNIVKVTASVYYVVSGVKKLSIETRHRLIVDALTVVIDDQNISDEKKDILKSMLPSVIFLVLDLLNCIKEKTIQLEKSIFKCLSCK
jgi:hypothetical protein